VEEIPVVIQKRNVVRMEDKKMGYTTSFEGKFILNKELDDKTFKFLKKLSRTRRMKRDIHCLSNEGFEKYGFSDWGIEGEFFVDAGGFAGQDRDISILDYNIPPITQPSLWCQWEPTGDRKNIKWDGGEKFYKYEEWLNYIIGYILEPRNYILNGNVSWQGEDPTDFGQLKVEKNKVYYRKGKRSFKELRQ